MTTTRTEKADLIVIGSGGAGLAATVAAAEKGLKKITLIEARAVQGGNAVFVGGMFAARSRLQSRLGIDADCDDLFRKAMGYGHWKTNPKLVRALIDKSGDTVQWLEDHGLTIGQMYPFYPNQVPVVFHLHSAPEKLGAHYVKTFKQQCRSLGVDVRCKTRAKALIKDAQGRISGILAETADGNKITFNADSIILATGGFLGNAELIRSYLPGYNEEDFHLVGIPHKGDGLKLATDAGAALDGMLVLEMNGPTFPPSTHLSIVVHQPYTVWINKKGERFTDESLPYFAETANCVFRQPGRCSYTLFDTGIKQRLLTSEISPLEALLINQTVGWQTENWQTKDWTDKVEKDLDTYAVKGKIKISDSLEDIAGFIGAPPEVLKQEIELYNTCCDKGHDPVFAKDRRFLQPLRTPPYYAVQAGIKIMATHGGPKINQRMEVLNHEDDPIPGLFAAGVETGCTDSNSYDSQLTGHSFGFSVVSGRIAGESAADYSMGSK